MAMSASDMATQIINQLTALGITDFNMGATTEDGTSMQDVLEAFCQGIIDGIVTKADITTTTGAPNSEHTGKVTG